MKNFYVTMIRGTRVAYLAGPFKEHEAALKMVPAAREKACEVDPYAHFDAFGTASLAADRPGVLNKLLGVAA